MLFSLLRNWDVIDVNNECYHIAVHSLSMSTFLIPAAVYTMSYMLKKNLESVVSEHLNVYLFDCADYER